MPSWAIHTVEIGGGFLSGLLLRLPPSLVCIIGPRGSGKSTFAEALRAAISAADLEPSKQRADLVKANLLGSTVSLTTLAGRDKGGFTVRRRIGQGASIVGVDGRVVTTVDLDRGTFLPLDAYSSTEIEAIADETLGKRRRALLDDLASASLQQVEVRLTVIRRNLDVNAEEIALNDRRRSDLVESREELGNVVEVLRTTPASGEQAANPEFLNASRQRSDNELEVREVQRLQRGVDALDSLVLQASSQLDGLGAQPPSETSANVAVLASLRQVMIEAVRSMRGSVASLTSALASARNGLQQASDALVQRHAEQAAEYVALQQKNQEAAQLLEARALAETNVRKAQELDDGVKAVDAIIAALSASRQSLKADYVIVRDEISALRERVAEALQRQAGPKVQIRVQRNADASQYETRILDALHGSKLKNQEELLRSLATIRPEELARIVRSNDLEELEVSTNFGRERTKRVLEALRGSLDLMALDVLETEDRVFIELDVSKTPAQNFKDASELSRGQKCTALLPILLARRDTPLLIDQPEDNLDNHFIYETVVDAIRRLRPRRQMIFITHNANIPVLGEADCVVVMNSDGRRGFVEKVGTVDECRAEIIDLLEGGEEAFDLRRRRYEG